MNYFEIIQDMVYCFHDNKQKWNIEMRLIRPSPSPFLRGHHCYQLGVCPFRPCFVHFHIYSEKVDCIAFYISNLHISYSVSLDFFLHTADVLEVLISQCIWNYFIIFDYCIVFQSVELPVVPTDGYLVLYQISCSNKWWYNGYTFYIYLCKLVWFFSSRSNYWEVKLFSPRVFTLTYIVITKLPSNGWLDCTVCKSVPYTTLSTTLDMIMIFFWVKLRDHCLICVSLIMSEVRHGFFAICVSSMARLFLSFPISLLNSIFLMDL